MGMIKNIFNSVFSGFGNEDYEEDEVLENEGDHQEIDTKKSLIRYENKEENKKKLKINRFNTRSEGSGESMRSVSIIRPKTFEDSRLIADSIKDKNVVTFSLEYVEYEVGQRIVDFVSGASYAMGAHLMKVTDKVLTCIPQHINYADLDETPLDDRL